MKENSIKMFLKYQELTLFLHNIIDWNIEPERQVSREGKRDKRCNSIEGKRACLKVFLIEGKVSNRLTPNQKKFVDEVIGTLIVVVFAAGSVVLDSKVHGVLGISFVAFAPFVGIAIAVYMFAKISMAHFNPAITIGFLITKHITKIQLVYCTELCDRS